ADAGAGHVGQLRQRSIVSHVLAPARPSCSRTCANSRSSSWWHRLPKRGAKETKGVASRLCKGCTLVDQAVRGAELSDIAVPAAGGVTAVLHEAGQHPCLLAQAP